MIKFGFFINKDGDYNAGAVVGLHHHPHLATAVEHLKRIVIIDLKPIIEHIVDNKMINFTKDTIPI